MFSLFGPSNSLILLFDHVTHDTLEEVESQIDEIARFYKLVSLSELVRLGKSRRRTGVATIAFKEARKSFFLLPFKKLQDREIPFTLFLRPDCIGTNRLSADDDRAWRKDSGILPLNEMDPTYFYGTWGNVLEAVANRGEVGIALSEPTASDKLKADVTFIKQQTGHEVRFAFSALPMKLDEGLLRQVGIHAILSTRQGVVEKKTSPFDLPIFVPEKTS